MRNDFSPRTLVLFVHQHAHWHITDVLWIKVSDSVGNPVQWDEGFGSIEVTEEPEQKRSKQRTVNSLKYMKTLIVQWQDSFLCPSFSDFISFLQTFWFLKSLHKDPVSFSPPRVTTYLSDPDSLVWWSSFSAWFRAIRLSPSANAT